MVCFFLFFIFFGGYLGAASLLLFTIVRTLHGAPFGALTVANSTMAIDVLPSSRRNEGIGYYGLSNNLAMAIAPTVAIYLYRLTDNFQLLFWLSLIIAGLGMMVDSRIQTQDHPRPRSSGRGDLRPESKPQSAAAPLHHKRGRGWVSLDRFFLLRGWILALNMMFYGFCFGVLSNYLAIYSKEVMNITGGTGTWFLLVSLGLIASRLQGARALREGKLVMNAAEGTIISSFAYLLFVVSPNAFGYYGSAILLGLGNGHLWPAFQNMIISIARHNERGTANSTLLISWDIGIGLGVLLGGLVSEHFSYTAAFWMVALAQLLGTAIFFLFTRTSYNKGIHTL